MSLSKIQFGQIRNGEFDNWETIDSSGQPYQDLVGWDTNNEGNGFGFAVTASFEIIENNDAGVEITASYSGLDGLYSGIISQTIDFKGLVEINYLSKCDSIYERGACVVNIYDASDDIIYTDSIMQVETNYTTKSIDVSQLSLDNSDVITVEFRAFGQQGMWEDFQAYSEFNLLSVNANYISNSLDENLTIIKTYPNPFDKEIVIEVEDNKLIHYKLFDSQGTLVKTGFDNTISTIDLVNGHYVLEVINGLEVYTKQFIKL